MRKRILAIVLSLAMVFGTMSFSAFALPNATTNEVYFFDVPETTGTINYKNISNAIQGTLVQEDGENFVRVTTKEGQAADAMNGKNVMLNTIAMTYGAEATGVSADIDNFDMTNAYFAMRIKVKDNNPAYSYTTGAALDIRIQLTDTYGGRTSLSASKGSAKYYFLDKTDGTKIPYLCGAVNSLANGQQGVNFTGSVDGWFLFPLSQRENFTAEALKLGASSLDMYLPSNGAEQAPATWANKELYIGDCFIVEDIEEFAAAKCPNYANDKKYAPNNAEDTAYYGVRIGSNEQFQSVVYWRSDLSKTRDDPTVATATGRAINHIVILPNGDRAVEFSYSEKISDTALSTGNLTDYTVGTSSCNYGNLSGVNTFDVGKQMESYFSYPNTAAGEGAYEIPVDYFKDKTHLVFRVATTGAKASYEANNAQQNVLLIQVNLKNPARSGGKYHDSYPFQIKQEGTFTYIDANTGAVKDLVFNNRFGSYGYGHTLKEDLDGYIIIPRSAFSNTNLGTMDKEKYTCYYSSKYTEDNPTGTEYTFEQMWGGARWREGATEAVSYIFARGSKELNYWDPAVKFFAGDVYAVSNPTTFQTYHTSCDALGHNYDDGVTTPATCTEDGSIIYTCQRAGCTETKSEPITKLGHDLAAAVTVDPTCEDKGYKYNKCQREGCDYQYNFDFEDALGHNWDNGTVVDPKCEADGYTEYACQREGCTETKQESPTTATGHDMQFTKTEPFTCTTGGYDLYTCANGCGKTEQRNPTAAAHTWDNGTVVAPKCEEQGYTLYTCTVAGCGATKKENYQAALGHTELSGDTVKAKEVCGNGCGKVLYDLEAKLKAGEYTLEYNILVDSAIVIDYKAVINLNGKTISLTNQDTSGDGIFWVKTGGELTINGEGTLNAAGNASEYKMAIWADGGKVIINGGTYTNDFETTNTQYDLIYVKNGGIIEINGGTFISATPRWTLNSHNTAKGTFVVKGGTFYQYDPSNINTDEGEGVQWVAKGYDSVADGNNYKVVEHSHNYVAGQVVAPTCEEQGYTVYTCATASCGNTENRDFQTATGHDMQLDKTVPPTCDAKGYDLYKCINSNCDKTEQRNETDPAHTWDNGTVVAPKCEEQGYTLYTCTVAGCTETKKENYQNALGHDMKAGDITAPNCEEQGYTVYTCANGCGKTENKDFVAATGHDQDTVIEGKAATCTEKGLTEGKKCSVCGEVQVAQTEIAMVEHDMQKKETVAPTTTEKGYDLYECANCDETEQRNFVDPIKEEDKSPITGENSIMLVVMMILCLGAATVLFAFKKRATK